MRFSFITLMGLTAWAKIPHDELQACEDCLTNSPGTQCQANPGGICYDLNPETGHCPPGTTPCIGVLETGSSCRDTGRDVIDQGCNETHPICVHANGGEAVSGSEGDHCAYCINTVEPNNENQVPPDEGCDEIHRVCVGDQQLAANVEGTACAVCFNSFPHDFDPNALDDGCPPTAPFCVNDDGDSPELWTPGTVCVANCFDTSVSDADEGCPRRYPICTLEDGSDPGTGNPGVQCALCTPASCDDEDPCTDNFCDPEAGCSYEDNGTCDDVVPEAATCENPADWTCLSPVTFCTQYPLEGGFGCICDVDVEGTPFCWRDDFCANVAECSSNDDCAANEKCATSCCGGGHCLEDCALTANNSNTRRRRRRHLGEQGGRSGKTGSGS